MVSQRRSAVASRDRLLAAASAEFAARGFDGAKVDRIAAKARLNKAMIYYHFKNKAELYREILVDAFRTIADAVTATAGGETPELRIRQFIRAVAGQATSRPHFAAMWLREMADGGRHIDAPIVLELRRVIAVLGEAIGDGHRLGRFRAAHPLVTQLGIVAPVLFFAASQTARERLGRQGGVDATPSLDLVLQHIEAATLGALQDDAAAIQGVPLRRGRK